MKIIVFGAGKIGTQMVKILGKDNIIFFVDNDESKWGTAIEGIPVYSPEKLMLEEEPQVCVAVSMRIMDEIVEQLNRMGINNYTTFQDEIWERSLITNEKMKDLRNKFEGKRCFIIGTGPSLRVEDLEALQKNGEICFASNKIFKLYDRTSWRPDLYSVIDYKVFSFYYDEICKIDCPYVFMSNLFSTDYAEGLDENKMRGDNKYTLNLVIKKEKRRNSEELYPGFSTAPYKYIVDGMTVTYAMMQIAYFLGFKEMCLLGIDFNYGDTSGLDVKKADHFCSNYIAKGEVVNPPRLDDSYKAYMVAEEFSRKNGFRIYNATRGGKLEVFERVNIEDYL